MNNDPLSWIPVKTKIETLHEFRSVSPSFDTKTSTLVQPQVIIKNREIVTVLSFEVFCFLINFLFHSYAKIFFPRNSMSSSSNYPI